jgi:hypothetical protein
VQYVRRFSAAPSIQVARGNLNSSWVLSLNSHLLPEWSLTINHCSSYKIKRPSIHSYQITHQRLQLQIPPP